MAINKMEIKNRFRIGQRVQIKQNVSKRYIALRLKSTIVGIYDNFIVVHNGIYAESFAFIDIALGLVEVRAVKVA